MQPTSEAAGRQSGPPRIALVVPTLMPGTTSLLESTTTKTAAVQAYNKTAVYIHDVVHSAFLLSAFSALQLLR